MLVGIPHIGLFRPGYSVSATYTTVGGNLANIRRINRTGNKLQGVAALGSSFYLQETFPASVSHQFFYYCNPRGMFDGAPTSVQIIAPSVATVTVAASPTFNRHNDLLVSPTYDGIAGSNVVSGSSFTASTLRWTITPSIADNIQPDFSVLYSGIWINDADTQPSIAPTIWNKQEERQALLFEKLTAGEAQSIFSALLTVKDHHPIVLWDCFGLWSNYQFGLCWITNLFVTIDPADLYTIRIEGVTV